MQSFLNATLNVETDVLRINFILFSITSLLENIKEHIKRIKSQHIYLVVTVHLIIAILGHHLQLFSCSYQHQYLFDLNNCFIQSEFILYMHWYVCVCVCFILCIWTCVCYKKSV